MARRGSSLRNRTKRNKSIKIKYDQHGRVTNVSGGSFITRGKVVNRASKNMMTDTGLKAMKSQNRTKVAQTAMTALSGVSTADQARDILMSIYGKEVVSKISDDQIKQLMQLAHQAGVGQGISNPQQKPTDSTPTTSGSDGTSKGWYIS